ncbi:Phosphoinositide phosphatase SAC8 [Trichinella pseudospiralis]
MSRLQGGSSGGPLSTVPKLFSSAETALGNAAEASLCFPWSRTSQGKMPEEQVQSVLECSIDGRLCPCRQGSH